MITTSLVGQRRVALPNEFMKHLLIRAHRWELRWELRWLLRSWGMHLLLLRMLMR